MPAPTDFLNALGAAFTGYGKDQQNRQDAAERQQSFGLQQQLRDSQIAGNQAEAQARAAKAQQEQHRQATIRQHAKAAMAGDPEAIAAIVSVAPELMQTLTKEPAAPRNIDPLSPQGIEAQQRLARYQAGLRPQNVGPDGQPIGRPNEGNLKNAAFHDIAQHEGPALTDMASTVTSSQLGRIPIVGNTILAHTDPKYQAQQLAGDRWIMQWLRSTSGAAIGNDELKNYRKQYIPQAGDTPESLAGKAAARADVEKALETMAGPAMHRPPASGHAMPDARPGVTLGQPSGNVDLRQPKPVPSFEEWKAARGHR